MRILVIHNRYQRRGGEDSVFETECAMLEAAGHTVVRFEVSNDAIPHGLGKYLFFFKTIWNRKSAREIRDTIRREKPDVAHFHNTFPLISPSAYYACAAERVPVVQTIHNFRLCCLNAYLLRDAKVCELCLGKNPWRGVARKCYRDSFAQSLAVWTMLTVHRALGTFRRKVGVYIALTEFGRRKLIEAGLPADKI
ncbi:MAG: glycosyltransferase, partial [Kiritimatiellaeota bacterium]|nr:glycosyltransferase [Kiritimatiellota bacterium]